jgi:ankyrin repeat protein
LRTIFLTLIEAHADINAPPAEWGGRTALQAAAAHGSREYYKDFDRLGAHVDAPPANAYGATALQLATTCSSESTIRLLIRTPAFPLFKMLQAVFTLRRGWEI